MVTAGIPPEYVEIGNELYINTIYSPIFPNVSTFIPVAKSLYSQGKGVSSSLKFSVPLASDSLRYAGNLGFNPWVTGLSQAFKVSTFFDAITVHAYIPNPSDMQSSSWPQQNWCLTHM